MSSHAVLANPPSAAAKSVAPDRTYVERATRRVPHRVPCRVRLIDPATGAGRTVVGETVDLSAGGVALQLGSDVPVGTWVETLVPHLHGEPLFLCGTVVHSRRTMAANYEIGIALGEAPPTAFS